jgi:hypothetical protein
VVQLESDAQLTGILAEFAKTGGVIVAEALIAEFARRFSAHMNAEAAGDTYIVPESDATLDVAALLAALLRQLKRWLGRKVSRSPASPDGY